MHCPDVSPSPFHKAWNTIVNHSIAGLYNESLQELQAVASFAYLDANPNFPLFNEALYGAVNGNLSGFPLDGFAAEFTQGVLPSLLTFCSDWREFKSLLV